MKKIGTDYLNLELYDGQPYPTSQRLKEGMDKIKNDYKDEISVLKLIDPKVYQSASQVKKKISKFPLRY